MTRTVLRALSLLGLFVGCTASTSAGNEGGIPTNCFTVDSKGALIHCSNDAECGAEARCNQASAPPSCTKLHCLPATSPCSDASQCQSGMKCHERACNRCDICGNLCSVDFSTDPKNCGECGHVLSPSQLCVDGQPTCPEARPTLCGDECVDTATDPRHCGACDTPAPAGGTCAGCAEGKTDCSGKCVDLLRDSENCGGCGKACKKPTTCSLDEPGLCSVKKISGDITQTCAAVCASIDIPCIAASAYYKPYYSGTEYSKDFLCTSKPPAPLSGYGFNQLVCYCAYRP